MFLLISFIYSCYSNMDGGNRPQIKLYKEKGENKKRCLECVTIAFGNFDPDRFMNMERQLDAISTLDSLKIKGQENMSVIERARVFVEILREFKGTLDYRDNRKK